MCSYARIVLTTAGACVAIAVALPAGAQAPRATVLVLAMGDQRPSPELVATLAIHLPEVEIRRGTLELEGDLSSDLPRASAALAGEDATVAVWIQRTTDHAALLHVVGRRHDIALVRVVEVLGAPGSDLDRALALTVAELLDQVLAMLPETAPRGSAEPPPLVRALAPIDAATPDASAAGDTVWGLGAEIGAAAALGTGTALATIGARFALGLRARTAAWIVETAAALTVPVDAGASRGGARVSLRAYEAAVEVRALARLDPTWSLGAALALGVRVLEARGTAADGTAGSRDAFVATLSLAPDLRFAPAAGVELRASLGVEIAAERRRFSVSGAQVLDLGWARPIAVLSIVLAVP